MKQQYRLSIDDTILVFRDLAEHRYPSLFDNAYLAMLRVLHGEFQTKLHLNIYFQTDGFCLSQMPDCYRDEWQQNADWLQLSFHALQNDPPNPYQNAGYDRVLEDCRLVQHEICRFAGERVLSSSTTLHYCTTTKEGCRALHDCGVRDLVGLFYELPCYHLPPDTGHYLLTHSYLDDSETQLRFFANDLVLNNLALTQICPALEQKREKQFLELMIHEQYYHEESPYYQPDFEKKLRLALGWLTEREYQPIFLSQCQ
ncbi:MAG: hypothetical protein RR185_02450 [Angelakisella sp.]